MNTILWIGPVTAKNLEGSFPSNWNLRVYNKGANNQIGSTAFRQWANELGQDPLSVLAPGADRVIMAAFSAGHGATEVILGSVVKTNDQRLVGQLSSDSYYVGKENPLPKPNHRDWLHNLVTYPNGRRAWFTTSHTGGPGYLSAAESFRPVADELELEPSSLPTGMMDVPSGSESQLHVRRRGGVVWLDYGAAYSHVQHATKLAPAAIKTWFSEGSPSDGASDGLGLAMVALLGTALLAGRKKGLL